MAEITITAEFNGPGLYVFLIEGSKRILKKMKPPVYSSPKTEKPKSLAELLLR